MSPDYPIWQIMAKAGHGWRKAKGPLEMGRIFLDFGDALYLDLTVTGFTVETPLFLTRGSKACRPPSFSSRTTPWMWI
ncbi:MAG: hypothetical protein JWP91_1498 [Fibrobacteres bacterium]|nr:hypothetical protein [Fibrobacterota bacterium]